MENNSLKIIFFGTSEFAEIILNKLLQATSYKLQAIITQPDQPVGRKKILTPPPVKILAGKNNIPVLQPEKFNVEFIKKIKSLSPDIFIVAAYGKIIPQSILIIPKYGALNVHPSLLPKYRGPSPIQTALLNDNKTTGVTIMLLDEQMDHGPIIANCKLQIANLDTYQNLSKKLASESANLLIKTIPDYIHGKTKPQEQNHKQATFTKIIKKEDGQITPNKTAQAAYHMWQAYMPWPGIFFESRIKNQESRIKLLNIELADLENKKNNPLELFIQDKNLYLTCAKNSVLKINKLQPSGKKAIDAQSFINGYMKE